MQHAESPTVLIVRGAGRAGRRIAAAVTEAGATPVVLDERTCANDDIHSVRIAFDDPAAPSRAIDDITVRHGGLDAVVVLPAPTSTIGATAGTPWELSLGHELTLIAGVVRAAASALAESSGMVIPVSASPSRQDPSDAAALISRTSEPVIEALAETFGFRIAPVASEGTGESRDAAVAEAVVEQLQSSGAPAESGAPRARAG